MADDVERKRFHAEINEVAKQVEMVYDKISARLAAKDAIVGDASLGEYLIPVLCGTAKGLGRHLGLAIMVTELPGLVHDARTDVELAREAHAYTQLVATRLLNAMTELQLGLKADIESIRKTGKIPRKDKKPA